MKLLRRFVAPITIALSSFTATRATSPSAPSPTVETDDEEARTIAEHPMQRMAHPEYAANYTGPSTAVNDELLTAIRSSKRFRNAAIDVIGRESEFSEFVRNRTR